MRHPSTDVVVTGADAIVAGVVGTEALWPALQADRLLPDHRLADAQLAQITGLTAAEGAVLSRQQLLGLAAAERVWRQAALPALRQPLRGERHMPLAEAWRLRAGVVSASALGNVSALLSEIGQPDHRCGAHDLSRWRGNALGAALALRFGLQGDQFNLNAASSSGAQALALAARCIAHGDLDLVLVVGAEPPLESALVAANLRSGAMDAGGSSRPLTSTRAGMVPREAAAALVLERRQQAQDRGAPILARFVGSASGTEAHHLVAPLPGQGLSDQLLRRLLARLSADAAGERPQPIDWLCLHATGTRRFDGEELGFVKRAFARLPWITAMKRSLGHGLGAAGVVEAALIVEGLRRRELPPWPADLDPALGLPEPPPLPPPPRTALQLASGMGGVVVMNLLEAA